MQQNLFANPVLDQSNDLIWVINTEFELVYANKAYLNLMLTIAGVEKNLNEPVFVEGFGKGYIDKWKVYYTRAFQGEHFEIEEHFFNPQTNNIEDGRIAFTPLFEDNNKVFWVACQSKAVSQLSKEKSNAEQLMDASLDTFCTFNEDGKYVFVSAASEFNWGYLPSELIGKSSLDFILEEDIPQTEAIAAAIIEGKEVKAFVNRYKRKDGTIAYNLWSARWDNESKPMYCVARDAREKVEQEILVTQSEQRFKALVQEGSDLIAILDQEGKYFYVSPTSLSVLGIAPEEFIGRNAFEFIHPEDIERTLASLQKISTQSKVLVEPFRFQNQNKEWRWIETILTNMLDNPSVNGIVANSRDITDKIEEEHKLKLLEKVINSTTDAIMITSADLLDEPGPSIVYVNQAFTTMTGYTAEEALGKNQRFLQGPESNKEDLQLFGKKLREGKHAEITVLNYTKTGEEFWVNFRVDPVTDHRGNITHWISIQNDVTEQKNRESEKELIRQISLSFSAEEELYQSARRLCEYFYAFGKFDLIELWCPNLEQNQILLIANHNNEAFHKYEGSTRSFEKNVGMPGQVWHSRRQLIWDKKQMDQNFIRSTGASQIGLQSVLGIPLSFNDEITGVLIIGNTKENTDLSKYCNVLLRLEKFIGSEINRKRLEIDWKHLYDSIPDILCITDFSGRFLKINKAGCDLLRYSPEDILFHSLNDFVHPEDKEIFSKEVSHLGQKDTTFQFEIRSITKDEKIIWLSWNCNSVIHDGLIYASAKNITKEKQLRELNLQANTLSKIGVWEIDLEHSRVYWSKTVHQMHETDYKTFVPNVETAINFYREDCRQLVASSIEKSISTGEGFDFEAVIITKNLKEKWVRAIGGVEKLNGISKRIFGSFQDITDRKEPQLRLQSFANNLPGVAFQYFLYPNGNDALKYVTEGARKVWGFTAESVVNDNNLVWDQIKLGGEIQTFKQSISESIQNNSIWSAKWRYVMPDNELRIHAGYGSPAYLPDGTIVFNSLILDVTEESKNKELLHQASNMAKIGTWELNLLNAEKEIMYWSPMTKEIFEVDDKYIPILSEGFKFFTAQCLSIFNLAMEELISKGIEFDKELLITTQSGNKKWIRCIGKSENVNGKISKIYGSFQDIHTSKSIEIRMREILLSISDAFYAVGPDWNFTYFNKKAEILLKRGESEIIGKNLWEEFPSVVGTDLESIYKQVVKTEKSESFEYLYPEDGCWYELNAYPSGGGVSVYFKNINERKQAAEDLERAFKERNEILESIGDAFFAVNREWVVTYWNKQAEIILGRKREDIIGKNLWEEYTDTIESDFYSQYHLAMSGGEIVNFEEFYATLDMWIEVTVYPSEKGLSIYFKDITLRKKADIRLLQANERFELATRATNDTLWDWNIAENAFFRSQNISKLFGPDAHTELDQNHFWHDNFHPNDLDKIKQSIQDSLIDNKSERWEMEYKIFNEKEEELSVIDRGVIVRDEQGKAIRMVGAMTDLTKQKKLEKELFQVNESLKNYAKELEHSNRELEQFAFITSHDLQEPLRMISSFMDQLRRNYEDQLDEKALKYIDFASDGAKRMKQIILDLLLYSRADKPEEKQELVDLNEILSDFKQLRRKLISEKSATILSADLPRINTYKAPITQIFHCLLDNGLKYSKEGINPQIEISALEKESEWEFSIKDNGIGIDAQFFEKIFIMFQRLHNRDQYEGTGIGLSIVKKSVEFLGGTIWLSSVIGEGSIFYFTISKNE